MFDFIKTNRFRISVVLIFIVLLVYIISQIDRPRSDNWISALVQNITYPFQATFHFVTSEISDTWTGYIWLVNARKENKQLKDRIKQLEEINASNEGIRISYYRLLKLLEFEEKDPNIKLYAEVVVEYRKPFSKLLIINKGSKHGIRPNFGVVTPEGIVGKIQSVTNFQSVVQLISDSQSQFPILIQRTRTKAMLEAVEGQLKIQQIPRRLELKIGDKIVTSGLAGVFPKGFLVGQIESIDKKEFGLFQSAVIAPAVDLSRIEEVSVILKNVENIHQPLFTDQE